jgi:prepilin-type N-terminal cleavage/methylation domain-containing protein
MYESSQLAQPSEVGFVNQMVTQRSVALVTGTTDGLTGSASRQEICTANQIPSNRVQIFRGTEAMTKATCRKSGFTLVEVLIVVVIMAILAATIIPQFTDSTLDAKNSSAQFNLHTLRQQIELYKSQHDGAVPDDALTKLTTKTDKSGSTTGDASTLVYGPYLKEIPANPYNGLKTVTTNAGKPTNDMGNFGYVWDTTNKILYLNNIDPKQYPFSVQ